MPLCGSSACGCAIVSVPATSAEINGAYPTIDVAGNGTGASPWNLTLNDEWAGAVAGNLNGIQHEATNVSLDGSGRGTITFARPFTANPTITATVVLSTAASLNVHIINRTSTNFMVQVDNEGTPVASQVRQVNWIAVGTLA